MAGYPSPADCLALLRRLRVADAVVAHAQTVGRVAVSIAEAVRERGFAVDVELVRAGALLHDAGRARTHAIDHASMGAQMLRDLGLPERLCLVVERHTGGGIDAQEAARLGLPVRDYTPLTLEEKIVCQADNLVDGPRRQKVQEELAHLRGRGLDHVAAKIERLHAELSAMAGRDLDDLA